MDEKIYYLIGGAFIGYIMAFPISYLKRKGINIANFEDSPAITQIIEEIKSKFQKITNINTEEYKKLLEVKLMPHQLDKELKMKSYDFTLKRVIELDEKINQAFWLFLDNRYRQAPRSDEDHEKLLNIRRFIFDSGLYVDGEVISSALHVFVLCEQLLDMKERHETQNDYYMKNSAEMRENLDKFKKLCKEKYHFDNADAIYIGAKNLEANFEEMVKKGSRKEI